MPLGFTFTGDSLSPSSSGPANSGLGISIQGITTGGMTTGGADVPITSAGPSPLGSLLSGVSPTELLIVAGIIVAVLFLRR